MFNKIRDKKFANGVVYALQTKDNYPIETTDTFLPSYTKDAIGRRTNALKNGEIGSRLDRWMIGVSVMSGCPVGCKFCATGNIKGWIKLTAQEIVEQVKYILRNNPEYNPRDCSEFKINYTRMGEPFLNIEAVKEAIRIIDGMLPGVIVHHYISTVGIQDSDFSWVKDNITLQVSVHSLDEVRRDDLIPFTKKMTLEELGRIRTDSELKTTVNLTLVDNADFDIDKLKQLFDPKYFFIKLSPINPNKTSESFRMGDGVIKSVNLL